MLPLAYLCNFQQNVSNKYRQLEDAERTIFFVPCINCLLYSQAQMCFISARLLQAN
jgi:hypothetical protein